VLSRLRALLGGGAELDGIRVASWLGDGAMLVGQHTEAVVALVLSARDTIAAESPLPLRGGIAVGSAIMFEGDDYVGAAVNLAARLSARALPNQVLATGDVTARVPHPVALRPVKRLKVPGFEQLIDVHELVGARPGSCCRDGEGRRRPGVLRPEPQSR
jgi:class 3 adenylate cyclase